jgi:hypothetical protein
MPGIGFGVGPVGTLHVAVGSPPVLMGGIGIELGVPGVPEGSADGGAAPRPTSGSVYGRGAVEGGAPAGPTSASSARLVSLVR